MATLHDHAVRLMGDTELIAENTRLRTEVERCHARLSLADEHVTRLNMTVDALKSRLGTVAGRLRGIADTLDAMPPIERPEADAD